MATINDRESATTEEFLEEAAQTAETEVYAMPATPSQLRYWMVHQMRPDSRALNMPLAWKCKGYLDHEMVVQAYSSLMSRHESLRTTFEMVDGALTQVIHPRFEIQLPVDDLRNLPAEERAKRAEAIIRKEAQMRMDLEQGPLVFARLIRMDADEYILLTTIHHCVCDGWSNGIVLRDFAAIYDGLMRKVEPSLPELPIQFGDYAVWLEEWRQGPGPAESLTFWRQSLGREFKTLQIPRDNAEGATDVEGEIETHLISTELVARARDYCAREGMTLYTLLLGVYILTLARLTGQDDVLVGTPCANRRAGTEDLIGPFSNPQIIRVKIHPQEQLRSVLESVRVWTLGAVAHQELPFEDLLEDEFFLGEHNQIPLSAYFIFQKAFMQEQHTSSLAIVPRRSVSPGALFDLMLSVVERAEGPRLQLEYNPGFFRASTIDAILGLFVEVLEAVIGRSGAPVEELPAWNNRNSAGSSKKATASAESASHVSKASGNEAERAQGSVAPRTELEVQLASMIEGALGLKDISVRANLFDLGMRSLAAMRIISKINKVYSVDFGLATLMSSNTVELLAERVGQKLSTRVDSALVPIQPRGSAAPLFILHGAMGNVVRFYQLAMLIETQHPVYGVQAQSLLTGARGLLRLEDQAAFYISEIRRLQPKGPYYFLGYSFGGTLGLEMAHQLREAGEEVALLGMLDSRERENTSVVLASDSVKVRFDRRMGRFWGNIGNLSFAGVSNYLAKKIGTRALRRVYMLVTRLGLRSVPSFLKNTEEISWIAAMHYISKPWPGKITLFRTMEQPDPRLPRDLGWTKYAREGVEIYDLPGDHDSVFRDVYIKAAAQQIRTCLDKLDASRSPESV